MHETKIHIDLFSGIGGFALASEMVWPDVQHVFCEIDPFCQAVLRKHWPNSPIYGDIRTLTNTGSSQQRGLSGSEREKISAARSSSEGVDRTLTADAESGRRGLRSSEDGRASTRKEHSSRDATCIRPDLLTGGFPCQPFSVAGRRRGTADDRYLWPEMLRVIRECSPRWVIAENVGGFVTWNGGVVLEQVHADLESEGYEVQAFIIPACALNAPHRRDRVWIVAHANSREHRGWARQVAATNGVQAVDRAKVCAGWSCGADFDASDTERQRAATKHRSNSENGQWRDGLGIGEARSNSLYCNSSDASHAGSARWQGSRTQGTGQCRQPHTTRSNEGPNWNENWTEVAARVCRVDDGFPRRMDGASRLKALGNAIVPQVAAEIMRAIRDADSGDPPTSF